MLRTQTLLDSGMVHFDARLSRHYPTIEIRVADVCLRADDAVLIATLARALVETEARAARDSSPASCVRAELLRLAAWRASRSGIDDVLINLVTGLPEQSAAVTSLLVEHVRETLSDSGEYAVVAGLLEAVRARGNGAAFQREAHRRSGTLAGVVTRAVAATAP